MANGVGRSGGPFISRPHLSNVQRETSNGKRATERGWEERGKKRNVNDQKEMKPRASHAGLFCTPFPAWSVLACVAPARPPVRREQVTRKKKEKKDKKRGGRSCSSLPFFVPSFFTRRLPSRAALPAYQKKSQIVCLWREGDRPGVRYADAQSTGGTILEWDTDGVGARGGGISVPPAICAAREEMRRVERIRHEETERSRRKEGKSRRKKERRTDERETGRGRERKREKERERLRPSSLVH